MLRPIIIILTLAPPSLAAGGDGRFIDQSSSAYSVVSTLEAHAVAKIPLNTTYIGPGPVSYDVSAVAVGTLSPVGTASFTSDGLMLDGNSDYARLIASDYRSSDTSGSIAMWVNVTLGVPMLPISSADEGGSTNFMAGGINTDGLPYFRVNKGSNDGIDSTSCAAGPVSSGEWHSVVYESDGSNWHIYVDGAACVVFGVGGGDTGDWFGDIPAGRDNLVIGALRRSTVTGYVNGTILNVMIYDTPIGQSGALAFHNAGHRSNPRSLSSLQKGLVLDIPMNETFLDGSGFPDDLAAAKTTASAETGSIAYGATSATFDGGSWLAYAGADEDVVKLDGDFTVSFWFKTTDSSVENIIGYLFSGPEQWQFAKSIATAGSIRCLYQAGGSNLNVVATGPYNDGAWHIVIMSRSGTDGECWIDGTSVGTATISNDISTGGAFEIGRVSNDSFRYTGSLASVRIWDRALDAAERVQVQNQPPQG